MPGLPTRSFLVHLTVVPSPKGARGEGGRGGGEGEGGGGGGGLTHDLAGPSLTSAHINPAWKAVASVNMLSCAFVAADPVHEEMSRLNAEAP